MQDVLQEKNREVRRQAGFGGKQEDTENEQEVTCVVWGVVFA